MRAVFVIVLSSFCCITLTTAQPLNDDCEGALEITEVADWCSEVGEFSNEGATPSGYDGAFCFSEGSNDVWFRFTPIATDVTITVIGNSAGGAGGGTLQRPEVALYLGSCGNSINEQECSSDQAGNNIVELYKGGLAVGQEYLIRVQGINGRTGTFELCINNFNPPVEPGGDCFDASVLCNKDPFVVQQVTGTGSDPTEANDAPCLNEFGGNVESNSTWFTWTAATSGTLEFTLSPLNPSDDLDFVLYELPNGPLNCEGKVVVRCMASGDFNFPSPCMGPTGLRDGEDDIAEPPGCNDPRQSNFLQPLDMEEGKSYALMVNNFSSTGNGFKVEFGGSAEFLGPQAAFNTSEPDLTVCVGQPITFTDASTFALGAISKWTWSFGADAEPAVAETQGPHEVTYSTAGVKSIVLTVESDQGCLVTEIGTILVECCSDHFSIDGAVSNLQCPDDQTGAIDLSVDNPYGPYEYRWPEDRRTEDIDNLGRGDYTVTISDMAGCDTTATFTVSSPDTFDIDTALIMPTCNGGTDGAISLATSGGTPPYQYNWQKLGFTPNSTLNNLSAGDYSVSIRDENGCQTDLEIPLRELELILDPTVSAIDPPSCAGFSDGSIQVTVANGLGPFEFNWQDGQGFRDQSSLTGLPEGMYQVEVRDANLCKGSFTFDVIEPLPLALDFDVFDVSCFGLSDGEAAAVVSGGVGGYRYTWSDNQQDSVAIDLAAGTYTVTVNDANDCDIEGEVTLSQPPDVGLEVIDIQDVICNGEATGQVTLAGNGGSPPFTYSLDGVTFQPGDSFGSLPAGTYTFSTADAQGCIETVEASIAEPPPLVVDAGEDRTIDLGFNTRLRALANAAGVTFQWSPPDSLNCVACPDPVANPVQSTTYVVQITDEKSCTATDSLNIIVSQNRPIYVPNAFSPDGDGLNDYFTLYGGPAARRIRTLKVFDRWGELIFEKDDIPLNEESAGWDGTFNGQRLNNAVFVFFAEVEFIDSFVRIYEGDITLLR